MKVLIAEDDLMIADMAEEILVEHGYEVCGIARTVAEAVALGRRHSLTSPSSTCGSPTVGLAPRSPPNWALLAGSASSMPPATARTVMLTAADGDACLAKPYRAADLLRGLQIVADIVATGTASPPFPHGFQVLPRTRQRSPGS